MVEQEPSQEFDKQAVMTSLRNGNIQDTYAAAKTEWENSKNTDDAERISTAARVYAAVLKRKQKLQEICDFMIDELNPCLENKLKSDPASYARGLFAKRNLAKVLMTFDKEDILSIFDQLTSENPTNPIVLKYHIKTLYNLACFDDLNFDHVNVLQRIEKAFGLFDKYTELIDKTAKRLSLKKLRQKITLARCKFEMHYVNHDDMKNKLKDLLNDVGIKSRLSIKVMQLYINLYLQNYDITTASNYALRNFTKTSELLGADHPEKFNNQILFIGVLVKSKQYNEAQAQIAKLNSMIEESDGDWEFLKIMVADVFKWESFAGLNQEIELEEAVKAQKLDWLKEISVKANSQLYINANFAIMQHFMKFQRFDKIEKIIIDCKQNLSDLGVKDSYHEIFIQFFDVNSKANEENFPKMVDELQQIVKKCEEINLKKSNSIYSQIQFTFKSNLCQLLVATQQIEESKELAEQMLIDHKEYYKQNDSVETLATVHTVLGTLDLMQNNFEGATKNLMRADEIIRQSNGEEDEGLIEIYSMLCSIFIQSQEQSGIQKYLVYLQKRLTVSSKVYGKKHEAYVQVLEEKVHFCLQLNWNEEALISANELKIIQVEMFGGEANISVIETYKLLMTINYRLMKFNDALKAAQARLSLYRQFSDNSVDQMTITSLIDLATCQAQLQKFDDALASLKEADVKCKEIKDPSVEQLKQQVIEAKKSINKMLADYQVKNAVPLWQRIMPNTPAKIAVFATVFAAVSGVAAYAVLKNRHNQ